MNYADTVLLNRFFTRNTFKQIINNDESSTYTAAIRRYVTDPLGKTNGECISEIYHYLKNTHQNEYYYKNTLLNKLLLGIHSPRTTTALTEVPVARSKADFVLINGKAVVYEIKTDLDNFDRLSGQIEDYYKAFSYVVVVTSEKNYAEAVKKIENTSVGICVLTKKGTLSLRKKPVEFVDDLLPSVMFKILRKHEYEKLLREKYGALPCVSQYEYYSCCRDLFGTLDVIEAQSAFVRVLKERGKLDIEEYSKFPYELKFLAYFSGYKRQEYDKLMRFLDV